MDIEQKIRAVLGYVGISQVELSRRLGVGKSAFNQRVHKQILTQRELESIAETLGGEWVYEFRFPDGTVIR